MSEQTRERPDGALPGPSEAVPATSTALVAQLGALRVAAGEADALAAVTLALFDDADWSADPDPVLVDRVASLLGLLAKAAPAVITAVERFHGLLADALPSGAIGEEW